MEEPPELIWGGGLIAELIYLLQVVDLDLRVAELHLDKWRNSYSDVTSDIYIIFQS